jgi:oligoendopeptidase F
MAPAKTTRSTEAALGALPEWDLRDLYPAMDSPEVAAALARASADATAFAARYRGEVAALAADDPEALAAALAAYEALQDLTGRLSAFADLLYAADTSDPARGKFQGDVTDKLTALAAGLVFFELELNGVEDAAMEQAMARSPALARYRPWIEDLRKEKPHQLEEKLERLFLEKSVTGYAAWNRLFDETVAALRFKVRRQDLGLEATLNKLQDPDEAVRRAAAEALAATLKDHLRVFTLISNTLAKDKDIADRWRGFRDVADARHLANRVEPEVVDALAAAVREAHPRLSHRYYALKARWFGKDALDHWDRNAPLPRVAQKTYDWTSARATVLDAYEGFSPELAALARRFFDSGWIDAPVRRGKAPGAFAHPTVPSVHPYIMLNYQGRPRDVMTLAHELGHGVHQLLAAPNGALMAPTPLTLAETASVFGEMLTFRSLLAQTEDRRRRKALIASKVEDMLNTVVRQIAFYRFERDLHTARKQGELTSEEIGALWLKAQGESLGPSVRLGPGYETFWAYVPHFVHAPFYVYAYAFGDCLVNSLYAVHEKGDPRFAEKYLAMLAAGGAKHHGELLAPFGLDARDPGFWGLGLELVTRLIDELEAME